MNSQQQIVEGEQTLNAIKLGIDCMCKRLWPNGMSEDRITDYVVYHLYRRRNGMYRVYASDLFSGHAIEKYYEQFMGANKRLGMNYYIDCWLEDGGLSRQKITDMLIGQRPSRLEKLIYMPSEELIKKRFLNTELGYNLCQNSTTGWAPKSETCCQCKFKDDCIVATEKKFPELIRLRRKNI